jgi:5-methylcytosine-specific restriction endonuclease McrA
MRTILNCKNCKKDFLPISGHLGQQFCSKKCGYEGRKNGKKGKKYPHLQRAEVRNCILCGKEFRAVKDFKNKKQKYCSWGCFTRRSPAIEKKCLTCGKKFKTHYENNIYCSMICRNIDYRYRFTGEKSHLWKGGTSFLPYSPKWTKHLREQVRERDQRKCFICKEKAHAVHHIDYNKRNCEEWNLITLCNQCHSKTNHNRENWIKFFQPVVEWLKDKKQISEYGIL